MHISSPAQLLIGLSRFDAYRIIIVFHNHCHAPPTFNFFVVSGFSEKFGSSLFYSNHITEQTFLQRFPCGLLLAPFGATAKDAKRPKKQAPTEVGACKKTVSALRELRSAAGGLEAVLHKVEGLRPLDFTGFFEGL